MQIIETKVPANWDLWVMGDIHVGATAFYEEGFLEVRERILTSKTARVVLTGDLIEAIATDDPRFDLPNLDMARPTPLEQCNYVIELLRPLAAQGKIIGANEGNHEFKLRKFGFLLRDYIMEALSIKDLYLGANGKISYRDKHGLQFKHWSTHGRKALKSAAKDPIQRLANKQASAKNLMQRKAGDTLLMTRGHNHHLFAVNPTHELFLTDEGGRVKQNYYNTQGDAHYIHPDHRHYGVAGSFYKTFGNDGVDTYAERAEYDPLELGCLMYPIRDRVLQNGEVVVV